MSQAHIKDADFRNVYYLAQNDGRPLTPAQRRRIRHKANSAQATARIKDDGTLMPRYGRMRRRLEGVSAKRLRLEGRGFMAMFRKR